MVSLEVAARDGKGAELFRETRVYRQRGVDADGRVREGAWQVREYVDTALQPGKAVREGFLMALGEGAEEAAVEITLNYCLSAARCEVVKKLEMKVDFKEAD
jgi:hypothetical protein